MQQNERIAVNVYYFGSEKKRVFLALKPVKEDENIGHIINSDQGLMFDELRRFYDEAIGQQLAFGGKNNRMQIILISS